LQKTASIVINPPLSDGCCEVCGKHTNNLKPFGGVGDPLVGDFNGAFLVKTFRSMAPPLTEEQMEEYREKHGCERADFYNQLQNSIEPSWECRDCIILTDEERLIKRNQRLR